MGMTRGTYWVDEAMCGDTWEGFDLEDFCLCLQRACDARNLGIDIVAVTDSWNGAHNDDPTLCPDNLFVDTLCEYANSLEAH